MSKVKDAVTLAMLLVALAISISRSETLFR